MAMNAELLFRNNSRYFYNFQLLSYTLQSYITVEFKCQNIYTVPISKYTQSL